MASKAVHCRAHAAVRHRRSRESIRTPASDVCEGLLNVFRMLAPSKVSVDRRATGLIRNQRVPHVYARPIVEQEHLSATITAHGRADGY